MTSFVYRSLNVSWSLSLAKAWKVHHILRAKSCFVWAMCLSNTMYHRRNGPTLDQLEAYRVYSSKQFPPMLTHCQLDPKGQVSVKFESSMTCSFLKMYVHHFLRSRFCILYAYSSGYLHRGGGGLYKSISLDCDISRFNRKSSVLKIHPANKNQACEWHVVTETHNEYHARFWLRYINFTIQPEAFSQYRAY